MLHDLLSTDDLAALLALPSGDLAPVVVVDLDRGPTTGPPPVLHSGVAAVVVGLSRAPEPARAPAASACDVVLDPADHAALAALREGVAAHPIASGALVRLLRGADGRTVDDGLLVESATYSALQAGPEFAAWRAGRPGKDRERDGEPVRLARTGEVLEVVLDRPEVRNALDAAMRDALVEAFALVALDPSITRVDLRGEGPSYSAGGDLDEFGSFPDPATAHLVRLEQSVGRAVWAVRDRVVAHVHGACVGSGIEIPAFAGRVVAAPDAWFQLPEVALGLVPGAGGTVSITRRIGRHRTARLALTGERLDLPTARRWGLVDDVEA
ncbi:MAG: enoyl-CoA hydratase/isomerase family protein [Acidimicrobiia bacterium]